MLEFIFAVIMVAYLLTTFQFPQYAEKFAIGIGVIFFVFLWLVLRIEKKSTEKVNKEVAQIIDIKPRKKAFEIFSQTPKEMESE